MKLRRIGVGALVVLALGSFLVACGDDDDDTTATGGDSKTTETTEKSAEAQQLSIGTKEDGTTSYSFTGTPTTLKAGAVSISLDNSTGKNPHDFQLVKLPAGHKLDDIIKTVSDENSPLETWLEEATGVGTAAPSAKSSSTVMLTEGSWGYFCTESTDQEGGASISHADHGMAGTFEVTGDGGGELPSADTKITASEYTFDVSGLKAGENTVEFHNSGKMLHHSLLLPIAEGKTFADAQKALTSEGEPTGPPPIDFEKGMGTAVVGSDQSLVTTWNVPAGDYVMICFMPDKGTSGPPHFTKGMLKEVKVS